MLTACGFGPNGQFRDVRGCITGHRHRCRRDVSIHDDCRRRPSGRQRRRRAQRERPGCRRRVGPARWPNLCHLRPAGPRVFESRSRQNLQRAAGSNNPPTTSPQPLAPTPQFDWQAWTSELDARLRALDAKKQDKGDYLQHGDLNGYLRTDDATKLAGELASRTEVESKARRARSAGLSPFAPSSRQCGEHVDEVATRRGGFFEGMSLGKFAVGALGSERAAGGSCDRRRRTCRPTHQVTSRESIAARKLNRRALDPHADRRR